MLYRPLALPRTKRDLASFRYQQLLPSFSGTVRRYPKFLGAHAKTEKEKFGLWILNYYLSFSSFVKSFCKLKLVINFLSTFSIV